jgi:hypothetical protein
MRKRVDEAQNLPAPVERLLELLLDPSDRAKRQQVLGR